MKSLYRQISPSRFVFYFGGELGKGLSRNTKELTALAKGDFSGAWEEKKAFAMEPVNDYKNMTTFQPAGASEPVASEIDSAAQLDRMKKKLKY